MRRAIDRSGGPFALPKSYILQIKPDVKKFSRRCAGFISDKRHIEYFCRDGENPNEKIIGLRVLRDIPVDLERAGFKLIGELRSILDKAMHAAAEALGSKAMRYANFPVAESDTALQTVFDRAAENKGPYRGIPRSLHAFLMEAHPYGQHHRTLAYRANSHSTLWCLLDISNPTKHEPILTIDFHGGGVSVQSGKLRLLGNQWNADRTECELYVVDTTRPADLKFFPMVCFNNERLRLMEAGNVMTGFADVVERVVLGLEAETLRILGL